MEKLPKRVLDAWEQREPAVVFTTVNGEGIPNSIYATCVGLYQESEIVIANNYFQKTFENIQQGSKATVLFITKEGKSFQIKGELEYHTEGSYYSFMKTWNPSKHPGHGAAVLKVSEIFSGKEKLL
ncbi:pyridoxamine 5'-phosphate oxidase-related, FMN binding protein [Sphaerochaeta pleomorpha str. Grapes]|uniref:Pyridoxamine 5'-phosphate oxidase-related, FMN binding protein n=1 Tax=Sphaerochaeta pleomorpha (strain ATCC BAA-1885 / DSM 22778 / Grapes) TaxID=158190 RepID=G8QUI8_SPHPG|nr:pyridoxamine 5'-phosphate oxidase family protein [Sphaerochaeta pleomorpha]AEV29221.1 pyridoxamine 5'-phosphate oxidase-related, FMN binding protein [Sphaerochaeta pleomorpha str. Grapes]